MRGGSFLTGRARACFERLGDRKAGFEAIERDGFEGLGRRGLQDLRQLGLALGGGRKVNALDLVVVEVDDPLDLVDGGAGGEIEDAVRGVLLVPTLAATAE